MTGDGCWAAGLRHLCRGDVTIPLPGSGSQCPSLGSGAQPTQNLPVSASWSPLGADLGGVRGAHLGRNASRMDVLPLVGRRGATPARRADILRIAAPGAVRRPRGCAQKKSTGLADASAHEPLVMPHIAMTGAPSASSNVPCVFAALLLGMGMPVSSGRASCAALAPQCGMEF